MKHIASFYKYISIARLLDHYVDKKGRGPPTALDLGIYSCTEGPNREHKLITQALNFLSTMDDENKFCLAFQGDYYT